MPRPGFLAFAFALGCAVPAFAQPVTRTELKPGLLFTATESAELANTTPVTRIEPGVALCLAAGEAVHPRSNGGETFTWKGYLNVLIPGKYKFDAVLLGKVAVAVGGSTVLTGEAAGNDPKDAKKIDGPEVDLAAGFQPVSVTLNRTGPAARLELIWKGPGFRPEPVPYFFFGHRPKDRAAGFAADLAQNHGRFLFEELSCVRCHKPDADDTMAKTLTERTGPNLTDIGRRVYPGWLDAWLADPQKLRPHTVMPKLFTDDTAGAAERFAVVSFLASLGGPLPEAKSPAANDLNKSLSLGQKLYATTGCAACHGDKVNDAPTAKKKTDDDEDEKPEAKPEDSFYAVGTAGPQAVYRLGAVGSKFTPSALAKFLENPLATNPHGRMPNMVLSGQEAQAIALFLCKSTDSKLSKAMPKEPEMRPADLIGGLPAGDGVLTREESEQFPKLKTAEQWKTVGKALLVAKGCLNCHALGAGGKPLPATADAPKLAALKKSDGKTGCLAAEPTVGKVPVYPLSAVQKSALSAFLTDGLAGPGSSAPAFQARLAVKRFNCLNCHNRDGEGGIAETLANQMKALENAENADDVQPPRLTSAGHKLRTPWLKQVLLGAGRTRPWMGLRMPQYGEANVGFLPDALPKLEGTVTEDAAVKVAFTPQKLEAGRTLAGKTANGFGCISCHDISGVQGGGTRGPDLATIGQRDRFDWYTRWMHQPQRLVPGTRMPQNFIDGKSQITAVLGGDADAQIEALWAYFALGPGLPLPAGIEPPGKALVVPVKARPEVLRTFMPDNGGTKAIAVGYPGGVNLVFDAATCRLGYAWTGNFLDAGPVWNNRGGAPANLLGPKFWTSPAGHPWAVTDSRTPPDFSKRSDDPAYGQPLKNDELYAGPRYVHFAGYGLDDKGNPSFRYGLDSTDGKPALSVTEKPTPLPVSVAAGIARSFSVDVKPNKTAWFLAATATADPRAYSADGSPIALNLKGGDAPELPAVGSRVVVPVEGKGAVVLDLSAGPDGTAWQVVPKTGGGYFVLLRLPESGTAAKVDFTLNVWGLSQDDEQLLKGLKK